MSTKKRQIAKYAILYFHVPTTTMQFISMDQIGEFYPKLIGRNFVALTFMHMLTVYTVQIPLKSKSNSHIVQAYVNNIYAKFGCSTCSLSDNGT